MGYVANGVWFLWLTVAYTMEHGVLSLLNPLSDFAIAIAWLLSWPTWALIALTGAAYFVVMKADATIDVTQAP